MISIGETAEYIGRVIFNNSMDVDFIEVQPGEVVLHVESGIQAALLALRRGWSVDHLEHGRFAIWADQVKIEVHPSKTGLRIVRELLDEAEQRVLLKTVH